MTTVAKAMPVDPSLITRLHDIIEPPAIGMWPWAPGWWLVALLVSLLLMRLMQYAIRYWRRNAYRREAEHALCRAASADFSHPSEQVSECLSVMRRCMLAIHRRKDVAALHGKNWSNALKACLPNAGDFEIDARVLRLLHEGAYLPPHQITAGDAAALLAFTQHWIKAHRR